MIPELDLAVIVAARPVAEGHASLSVDTATARVVRAADVRQFDTVLAAVDLSGATPYVGWFDEYTAHPSAFDPACTCGVCETASPEEGDLVVLTRENVQGPSFSCDLWSADDLVLIVPAA